MENIYIKQIMAGPMANYVYLVGDKKAKEAALIDPGWEASRLIKEAEKEGLEIRLILATHGHFDHANEIQALAARFSATLYIHEAEASEFGGVARLVQLRDGDHFNIGGVEVNVLHTPGHTPGSVCYGVGNAIFTGDTLFVDGIGRVDLPGGDSEAMFRSLARLRELPDATIVYPGHDYGGRPTSTIGEQKRTNPYLQIKGVSDFLRMV